MRWFFFLPRHNNTVFHFTQVLLECNCALYFITFDLNLTYLCVREQGGSFIRLKGSLKAE